MHDRVRPMLTQDSIQLVPIADIHTLENIALTLSGFSYRLKVTSVSKLIEIHYRVSSIENDMTNDCGANKPGATGN